MNASRLLAQRAVQRTASPSFAVLLAKQRRLTLKERDGNVDVLLLVVSDTTSNRSFLEQHREQLRGLLPLDSRQVLDAFRRGELPDRNGIVIV